MAEIQNVNTSRTLKFAPSENAKLVQWDDGTGECKNGARTGDSLVPIILIAFDTE
jgi:hypothetical protein